MITGIDVASYQSSTYDTAGLAFVFVKATEGTTYVNARYAAQVAHGRNAGLVVGHYHYAHGGNAAAQADYFLAHATLRAGDIIAFDWEETTVSQADRDAWIKRVQSKAPGHKVVLYCSKSFWKGRDTESYCGDGLWIADPDSPAGHPDVTHSWVFHQYGSPHGLDVNVANFPSVAAFRTWCGGTVPAPVPAPKPKPVVAPRVSLANVIYAAKTDPHAPQGRTTHPADVRLVEAALSAEGFLAGAYSHDGSFGTLTVAAYARWQRKCGYTGTAANGIPGSASLTRLGKAHGFNVG